MKRLARSSHSGALIPAPVLDHREAKARALCVLGSGDPLIAGRDALEALTKRNQELLDGDGAAISEALADQVTLLENVVSAYTIAAVRARGANDRKALQGVAIRASAALTRVLLTLHRISEDQRNAKAIPA